MFEYSDKLCLICGIEFTDSKVNDTKVTMSDKGRETLLQYSELHNDEELTRYLRGRPNPVCVHSNCRKKYTNKKWHESQKRHAQTDESNVAPKITRSTVCVTFDWKEHCFFCCKSDRRDTSTVMTLPFRATLMENCRKKNDPLAVEVLGRLESCCDLVAAEAFYHRACYQAFVLKPIPCALGSENAANASSSNVRFGRPVDPEMSLAFEKLCSWLEVSDDELYTLDELQNKMGTLSNSPESVYSCKQLKRKLEDKYGDHIFFSEINGRKNVIGLRNMVSSIITNKWYTERKENFVEESRRIVVAAAKLIKAEIRESLFSNSDYPLTPDFSNVQAAKDWVPGLLKEFMENVVCSELKQVAICHSIVQAARPRSVLSPILFGVGVSLDHAFGSRWALHMLSRLGYSISYNEVNVYKQSVMQNQTPDFPQSHPDRFTQWSGDNVDHNINTLDGSGTFHGMGIISMSTPYHRLEGGHFNELAVPRLQRVKVSSLIQNKAIPILPYNNLDKSSLSIIRFKPILHLSYPYILPPTSNLKLVWHAGCLWNANDKTDIPNSASIKKLNIDSTILFSRLLVIMQRSSELEPFFAFELTPIPTALFTTDGSLRKCSKSVLARELKKNIQESCATEPRTYVVDGGWLLHQVKWQQMVTYADTFQRYVQYVLSHFGMNVTIVFDGYCNRPNMKDHEHDRRSLRAAPDIVFDENNPVY